MDRKFNCPQCGSSNEIKKYSKMITCNSCGYRVELYDYLSDNEKIKMDMIKSFKANDIKKMQVDADKLLMEKPNDFLANFVNAYCKLQEGNNYYLHDFLKNCDVSEAIEEELSLVLSSLTKTTTYFDEKCEFLMRVKNQGVDISAYNDFFKLKEKEENEKMNSRLDDAEEPVNIYASLFSLAIGVILILLSLILSDFLLYVGLMILIYTFINYFLVIKFKYNFKLFILSIIFLVGTYPLARLVLSCFAAPLHKVRFSKLFIRK